MLNAQYYQQSNPSKNVLITGCRLSMCLFPLNLLMSVSHQLHTRWIVRDAVTVAEHHQLVAVIMVYLHRIIRVRGIHMLRWRALPGTEVLLYPMQHLNQRRTTAPNVIVLVVYATVPRLRVVQIGKQFLYMCVEVWVKSLMVVLASSTSTRMQRTQRKTRNRFIAWSVTTCEAQRAH